MASREIDVFNLSFIDLLSCALGGVLLILFLVSGLLREGVRASIEAAQSKGATHTSATLLAGEVLPPPDPILFVVKTDRATVRPLSIYLIPPASSIESLQVRSIAADNSQLIADLNQWRKVNSVLSYKNPTTTIDKTKYRALFSITEDEGGNAVHHVMLPNSRTLQVDSSLPQDEGQEWKPHLAGWMIAITYPSAAEGSDAGLDAELNTVFERWEMLPSMKLHFRSFKPEEADAKYFKSIPLDAFDWSKPPKDFVSTSLSQLENVTLQNSATFSLFKRGDVFIEPGNREVREPTRFQNLAFERIFSGIISSIYKANFDSAEGKKEKLSALLGLYQRLDEHRRELGLSWSDWESDIRVQRTLKSVDLGREKESLSDLVQSLRRVKRKLIGVKETATESDVIGVEVSANTIPGGEHSGEQVFPDIELTSGQTVFFKFKKE